MKERVLEIMSWMIMLIFYVWWTGLYILWMYHSSTSHSWKDLFLSAVVPPWAFYRGIESFWHEIEDNSEANNKISNKEYATSEDKEWITYQPSSKEFSIKIPHEPKLTTTSEGWISDTNYSTTDQNMRIFYSIEHIILPKDTFNSPSLETWAKNARKSFHMAVEEDEITNNTWHVVWKIIPDENTEVFKWSNNGKVEMITRIQWNNIISARVAYDATLDRKYIDTFLNSFKFTWK